MGGGELDNAENGLGRCLHHLPERRIGAMNSTKNCLPPKGKKVLLRSSDKGVVMEDIDGAAVLICDEDGYGAYGLWCGTPGAATRLIYNWAKERGLGQIYEHLRVSFYNRFGEDVTSATKSEYGSFAASLE
jgi:hypothetical protein